MIWTVEDYKKDRHLTLSYNSYDGEQGKVAAMLSIYILYKM